MELPLLLQSIGLPGLSAELFVPDPAAVREAYQKERISFPYWSKVWPAAKALAQFIHQNPAYTKGKNILELGAGLGLPSLVAARNAKHVLCTDSEADAVAFASQSANHLRLQNFTAETLNWLNIPQSLQADVLLLSDVNYEPNSFDALQKLVGDFLQKGTTILLSTPQRLMARDFVAPLLLYCRHQQEITILQTDAETTITILVLNGK